MAIEITCIGCGRVLHVPEAAAGKTGKCPHCGTIVEVPVVEEQSIAEAAVEIQPPAKSSAIRDQRPATSAEQPSTTPAAIEPTKDNWLPPILFVASIVLGFFGGMLLGTSEAHSEGALLVGAASIFLIGSFFLLLWRIYGRLGDINDGHRFLNMSVRELQGILRRDQQARGLNLEEESKGN